MDFRLLAVIALKVLLVLGKIIALSGAYMPYRKASIFILALMAATIFAFWRSYFGRLFASSIGFHVHGVTTGLWMLLVQSITPHRAQIAVHRIVGKTTFVALPLFAAGSMGVIHSMAAGTVGGDPFYAIWGAPLGFLDILALGAVLYSVGLALRHRRNVRLHAGYMLSTALPLVSPVLGRVFNQTVPGIIIRGPQDFLLFGWGVQLANLEAAIVALWLWRRDVRIGRPWAVALGIIVVQSIGFETVAASETWRMAFITVGTEPLPALMAVGLAAGVAVVVAGWSISAVRPAARPAAI